MRMIFRLIYRPLDMPAQRHVKFMEAEMDEQGAQFTFPPEFSSRLMYIESISLFDADLIPDISPQQRELTAREVEWAKRAHAEYQEDVRLAEARASVALDRGVTNSCRHAILASIRAPNTEVDGP